MNLYKLFFLFAFLLIHNPKIYAANILNCPTCNLERNFCKNCTNKSINQNSSSSQINLGKDNKNLTWCAQDWTSDKESLWRFPFWVKNKSLCSYNIISEEEAINMIKKSTPFSERLCDFVSGNITEYLKPYFDLAHKYNYNCTKFNNSKSNINTNKINNKTKNYEDKCTEIGFKKGTEKFGECVLKLIDLK